MAEPLQLPDTCPFPNISLNNTSLTISHVNAQSARNKYEVLVDLLRSFTRKFDIIMLTETWYASETEVATISGYQSFFLNRSGKRGGGVFIAISDALPAYIVPELIISKYSQSSTQPT